MDTFFTLLKKSLVGTMFIVFAFVATYIPQPYNQVHEVEAGPGPGGGATLPMQITQNVNLAATNIAATASAGFDKITSWASNKLWVKEYILDGIGWALAKAIVSSMVSSLINWINSGFKGSPTFVQDLQGFLLQTADQVIGGYIEDLGGFGSFICSPFRLDIQVSVALQYEQSRGDGQPAPTCTLSGVIDNIEGFIGGSFNEGGWKDWFRITATPQTYTPYGSALAAEAGARIRIINAQEEETKLLEFGDGFLSGEICEIVEGPGTTREECFISKPGKIIQDALSFNLDTGRQTLISADEIDEVISALLGQLANTALTGAAGLLGLSGGTGYTDSYSDYDGAYADQLVTSNAEGFDFAGTRQLMGDALSVQIEYRDLAIEYEARLSDYIANPLNTNVAKKDAARVGRDDARTAIIETMGAFPPPFTPTANSLIGRLNTQTSEYDNPATTDPERLNLAQRYTELDLYTESDVRSSSLNWEVLLRTD
jgi:hypothetical protein